MNNKDELLFWTGIMRDHANFQVDALAPKEERFIERSTYYMNFFREIHEEIKSTDELKQIYPKLLYGLRCFIDHKRNILKNQLICKIAINLPPTAINHQMNEANQFMMLLVNPDAEHMDKSMRTMLFIDHLKLWAADSAGHAALLASFLEPVEGIYVQQALNYKMNFEKLTIKASELQMMLMYTGLEDGTLIQLGCEEIEYMTDFIGFCEKIKELRGACKIMALGTFTPLVPDHFIREHQHWIKRIEEYK